MGLEGRKVNDNIVMFGEPLNEKALNAFKNRSPTGSEIIKSLPKSAFINIDNDEKVKKIAIAEEKKKQEQDLVLSAQEKKRLRIEAKKRKAAEKKEIIVEDSVDFLENIDNNIENKKETLVEKIILEKTQDVLQEVAESEEVNMDLEAELEALAQEVKPVEKPVETFQEPEQVTQPELKDQILDLLAGEPNPPSEEHINAWKERYGRNGIHVMAFGEGDVYVYHHLTRGEWKKIKELMNRLKESSNAEDVEEKLKEKVCLYCVLWPSINESWLENCKAGILDSLYQMILLNSGFLTPQQAMLLTTQL